MRELVQEKDLDSFIINVRGGKSKKKEVKEIKYGCNIV